MTVPPTPDPLAEEIGDAFVHIRTAYNEDSPHEPDCAGCALDASLDGLLARLQDAERERDEWRATAEVLQETESMAVLFAAERDRADALEARVAELEAALAIERRERDEAESWLKPLGGAASRSGPEAKETSE